MDRLLFAVNDMREKIGLIPSDTREIAGSITGSFERFTILGESNSKKSGSLFFFDDGGYWAMNYKTGDTCNGNPNGLRKGSFINYKKDPDPRKEIAILELQSIGRKVARRLMTNGLPITNTPFGAHGYIDEKEISCHGFLQCNDTDYQFREGWLMVPLVDELGLCNIQFISPEGEKRFIKGAKKKGTYGRFGLYEKGMPVLMAEGMATARTLYDTLVAPVFFGVDAGNLTHALRTIIAKFDLDHRITKITIAADYDLAGTGEKAAAKALIDNFIEVNDQSLIMPNFNVSMDWNDVSTQYKNGKEAITQIFAAK